MNKLKHLNLAVGWTSEYFWHYGAVAHTTVQKAFWQWRTCTHWWWRNSDTTVLFSLLPPCLQKCSKHPPPPQYFKDLRRCKLFIVLPFQQSKMLQPVTLPLPQTVKAGVFTVVTVTKVYLSTVRFIWIGKLTLNNLSEYTVLAQRHGIIYQSKLNFKHNRQLCELFKKHMMEF